MLKSDTARQYAETLNRVIPAIPHLIVLGKQYTQPVKADDCRLVELLIPGFIDREARPVVSVYNGMIVGAWIPAWPEKAELSEEAIEELAFSFPYVWPENEV